ncbi:MAG: anti-sigma factor [Acidimicrobiia bacterium]|nr:anti-sigma factor [Acidimicrobiia bacterium]
MSEHHPSEPTDNDLSFEGGDTIAALLAEITEADRLRLQPPPSIWNAIAATIAADRDGGSNLALTLTDSNGSAADDLSSIERQATTTIALAARRRSTDQPTLPPEMSTWRRQWLPVAAAVAVAIVGGLVTWAFSDEIAGTDSDNGQTAELDGEVVAVTEITDEGLSNGATETGAIGEARLVRSGDRYYLDLDLDGDVTDLPSVEGYYELWIVDTDIDGTFSLGVVAGDGRYALPDNLDPAAYPVIDVSAEALDGDPTHSGRSVWRGRLDL